MKSKVLIILMVFILLSVPMPGYGRILFEEDFEGDTTGQEPVNFEKIAVNNPDFDIEVVNDPEGESGRVAEFTASALYVPKVAGRDDWTDWYWEWDWRWEIACNPGTAYRIEDPSNFYHFSPRNNQTDIGIWTYLNAAWVNIAMAQFPHEVNTWYRIQIVMEGSKQTVKIKERGDQTSFDQIEPAIEVEDDTFEKGAVSVLGVGPSGTSWMDNFIVYEDPEDILAVVHNGKLAVTWGRLKAE